MTDRATLAATVEPTCASPATTGSGVRATTSASVTLPGDQKLTTVASVVVSDAALSVSAFVMRNPDENHDEVYRWLLGRNRACPGWRTRSTRSATSTSPAGSRSAGVDAEVIDQLLGVVLTAADDPFDERSSWAS